MPKILPFLLAAICAGLVVASCNSGNSNPATPTPGPSVSTSPNPKISSEVIEVTVLGTPAAGVPVAESTPKDPASPRPGTTIRTQMTNKHGKTKFVDLKPSKTYCWVATVKPHSVFSACAGWQIWQTNNPLTLGT